MIRALPATWLLHRPRKITILVGVVTLLLFIFQMPKWVGSVEYTVTNGRALDWMVLTESGRRIAEGLNPYATNIDGTLFRWSPLAAWVMTFLGHVPPDVWRFIQAPMLAFVGDWRLIMLVLFTFPFWDAMAAGTITVPIVVIGLIALRSPESKWPALVYVTACALIPRPWMLPLAAWLLWKRPDLRVASAGIVAANVVGVALTGWGGEWLRMLLASGGEVSNVYNFGPTAVFGTAWLLVGLPLGLWLFLHRRVGLAALVASPYLFPHYYLAMLWDLGRLPEVVDVQLQHPSGAALLVDAETDAIRDDAERRVVDALHRDAVAVPEGVGRAGLHDAEDERP